MEKNKWISRAKAALKITIAAGALWFVFSRIPLAEVTSHLKTLQILPLLLAILLFCLSKFIAALRLNILFRRSEIRISEKFNLKLYLLGMFYNLFLPGGIGGDAYKIYLLHKKSEVTSKWIFWAVLTDRLLGVMALCLLAVILFYFTPLQIGVWQQWIWILFPSGLVAAALLLRRFLPRLYPAFPKATGLSFLVQGAQLLCTFALLIALDQGDDIAAYLFLFLISSVVAMLPLTIGGIGSRELTFLLGAEMMNLDPGISVALSLLFYLITLLVSLGGLIFVLNPGELKLKAALDSAEMSS